MRGIVLAVAVSTVAACDYDVPSGMVRLPVTAISSSDLRSEDFTDLRPVGAALRNARVVALGEPTHGDGTGFALKSRVVRYLHEELGFSVLLFESGTWDMERVDRALEEGAPPGSAVDRGLLSFWRESSEMLPLFEYVAETKRSTDPIILGGFDPQLTNTEPETWLEAVLELVHPPEAGGDSALAVSIESGFGYWRSGGRNTDSLDLFGTALRSGVAEIDRRRAALESAYDWQEVELVRRSLEDRIVQVGMFADFFRASTTFEPSINNPRDRRMADNILWALAERFPDNRVVLWMATAHASPAAGQMTAPGGNRQGSGMVSTGWYLKRALGDDYYVLGLTALGGYFGTYLEADSTPIGPPPRGSIEAVANMDSPFGFLDLRRWERTSIPRLGMALGLEPREGDWTDALDGLLIVREMSPSHRRP